MGVELSEILEGMLMALQKETGKGWKKIRAVSEEFAASNRERLQMIAKLHLEGELNEEEFTIRMEDEKLMLEAQLNALKVLSKATVQKAVNAAFKVFNDAIKSILP